MQIFHYYYVCRTMLKEQMTLFLVEGVSFATAFSRNLFFIIHFENQTMCDIYTASRKITASYLIGSMILPKLIKPKINL